MLLPEHIEQLKKWGNLKANSVWGRGRGGEAIEDEMRANELASKLTDRSFRRFGKLT
jgi:hypothetical protein